MVFAVQVLEPFTSHVRVDLGRRQVAMPQQQLHNSQISTTVQEVRCKRVAQAVRRHCLTQAGFFGITLDDVPECLAGHAIAAARRKQLISLALKEDFHAWAVDKFLQPTL